jgi:Meiotically up-regulated gene 113
VAEHGQEPRDREDDHDQVLGGGHRDLGASAMVFSDDAVGLETHLHHQLADRRLNLVNLRREFFRGRPAEVRDIITRLDASIVEWIDEPEALEWRQSQQARRHTPQALAGPTA